MAFPLPENAKKYLFKKQTALVGFRPKPNCFLIGR
jgi:hypothetical protein